MLEMTTSEKDLGMFIDGELKSGSQQGIWLAWTGDGNFHMPS